MKRIYSIHHYLGTFFFLLFLIWFLSGFVMMYKSFPFLSSESRINSNTEQVMDAENFLHPSLVFKGDSINKINELRINYQLNRPVYHIITDDGKTLSKYADTGKPIEVNGQNASELATSTKNLKTTIKKMEELDQWVPRLKYKKHLPIYKVFLNDEADTRIYVSSLSGEIISSTNCSDRLWAWLGAIPHWLYLKDIRLNRQLWVQLVCWLAGLGFVMVVTGIVTGLVRSKKKPKTKFKRFKNKWYNLHYYFGLTFGLVVCTWVFSGWMSMTPLDWTPSTQLSSENQIKWQGEEFTLNTFNAERWGSFVTKIKAHKLKEVNFLVFNNRLFTRTFSSKGMQVIALNGTTSLPLTKTYKKVISTFNTTDPILETLELKEYDNYYYSRHNDKALPIIRIRTASDIAYYINPKTTELVYKCSTKNRVQRWIYHGLHSLDFSFLTSNGILWDIVVIFLLLGGTVVSLTATILGIKFLKRKIRKLKRERKTK